VDPPPWRPETNSEGGVGASLGPNSRGIVLAAVPPTMPAWLCSMTFLANGDGQLTAISPPGSTVTIEVSSDLMVWEPLATLENTDGVLDFADPSACNFDRSFYRVVVEP
jgi:hypothetical protein